MLLKKIIEKIYIRYLRKNDQVKWARKIGVSVGNDCRLIDVSFSSEPYLVSIGNHVSATKVHFETHDGGLWVFRDKHPDWDIINKITIGDNVYLGFGCLILPGVVIENNVVVGANSVITKNLEANAVYAGVPARKIKDLNEYYLSCKEKSFDTKKYSDEEKKTYYLNAINNKVS
ncbi:TPA: acyltransferase [Klebsiella michiganensis]